MRRLANLNNEIYNIVLKYSNYISADDVYEKQRQLEDLLLFNYFDDVKNELDYNITDDELEDLLEKYILEVSRL